MRYSSYLPTQW